MCLKFNHIFFIFILTFFLFIVDPPSQALGSHGNSALEVDRDTAERMGRIQASYRSNKDTVLGELLRRVCDIQPEFHVNYRVAG